MREVHGVADATRKIMVKDESQSVLVCDGDTCVKIELSAGYAAGLTPEQARFLAKQLMDAAARVENGKAKGRP